MGILLSLIRLHGMSVLMLRLVIFFFRGKSLLQKSLLIMGFVVITIMMVTFNPRVSDKIDQIRETEFIHWGSTLWGDLVISINAISHHPWFGVGASKFPTEIVDYYNEYLGTHDEEKGGS